MFGGHTLLAFALAASALMLTPGPNVALIVSNSAGYGTRYGLLTVAGTATAMVVQLTLTVFGMTAVLGAVAGWLVWLRFIGVAYLLFLGVKQWRAAPVDLGAAAGEPRSLRSVFGRGFLISMTNPKTLLFYAAFFPQFVSAKRSMPAQLAVLSAIFLGLALLFDGTWALVAGHARGLLRRGPRLRNRISGGLLIAAGLGLALARKRS
jgi:homoserine/homoserine lactone efflux protein